MKLLTKELVANFRKTGSQEDKGDDAVVIAKYFHPFSSWYWYATEIVGVRRGGEELELKEVSDYDVLDADDVIFFGLVNGFESELGYFSLAELKTIRLKGLPIERDLWFKDKTLAQCRKD